MDQSEAVRVRSMSLGECVISALLRLIPVKHGKHRLLDRLWPRAWNREELRVWVPFHGVRLRILIDELVGWHFAILRSFDPEVVEVLVAAGLDLGEIVFWDVGANKGACSYALASGLRDVKIVAIEPQSALESDVRYNLSRLCGERYQYVRAGVGEREERLNLVIPASNTGRASLHMSESEAGTSVESVQIVEARRVADESWGWPDLVKIDVEGHESAVIRSMREGFITGKIKAVLFECHARDRAQFDEIRGVIDGLGYSIYSIEKTVFSTVLRRVDEAVAGVTDYAIVLDRFREDSGSLDRLIACV